MSQCTVVFVNYTEYEAVKASEGQVLETMILQLECMTLK